jgi:hypothetical protein
MRRVRDTFVSPVRTCCKLFGNDVTLPLMTFSV